MVPVSQEPGLGHVVQGTLAVCLQVTSPARMDMVFGSEAWPHTVLPDLCSNAGIHGMVC